MANAPPSATPAQGPDRAAIFRSVGVSIFVNIACPYLLYRVLEPRFPAGSLTPLLYASVFPLFAMMFSLWRKRMIDAIALIALFDIAVNTLSALFASNVTFALVGRASSGMMMGLFFLGSLLIGRPIVLYIARQFATNGDPVRVAAFDAASHADGHNAFRIITVVWSVMLMAFSMLFIAFALVLRPDQYLLFVPTINIVTNVVLGWWTVRFASARLRRA